MTTVVAVRTDGIGTRLLTILYARRFAELTGCNLGVHWPSLNNPYYRNDALLTVESLPELFAHGRLFRDIDVPWLPSDYKSGVQSAAVPEHAMSPMTIDEMAALAHGVQILEYHTPQPIWLKGAPVGPQEREIRLLWRQLNFTLDVRKACKSVLDGIDARSTIGVHVRRGDLLNLLTDQSVDRLIDGDMTKIFQRYLPLRTAVTMIRERFQDVPAIIVCSEDPAICGQLADEFPGKIVRSSSGHFQQGSNKAAVVDILLLSRLSHVVSPFFSLFSRCASAAGGSVLNSAPLDLPNLVPDLIGELDRRAQSDTAARKAVVYTLAYQNMWHHPETHPLKADLRASAISADIDIFQRMTDSSRS